MYGRLRQGNREISVTAPGAAPRAASGRPEVVADDERGGEVRLTDSTGETGEQGGAGRGGAGGGKRWDQEECGPAKHEPDTGPGSRVTGAGPHTGRCFQEQEGEADRAPAPRQHRGSGMGLLQPEEARGPRRRWPDVGPVRDRSGGQPRRSSRTGSCRNVSSAAIPPEVHTEGGWQTTAARHCCH